MGMGPRTNVYNIGGDPLTQLIFLNYICTRTGRAGDRLRHAAFVPFDESSRTSVARVGDAESLLL